MWRSYFPLRSQPKGAKHEMKDYKWTNEVAKAITEFWDHLGKEQQSMQDVSKMSRTILRNILDYRNPFFCAAKALNIKAGNWSSNLVALYKIYKTYSNMACFRDPHIVCFYGTGLAVKARLNSGKFPIRNRLFYIRVPKWQSRDTMDARSIFISTKGYNAPPV